MCNFKSVIWTSQHGIVSFYGVNSHAEISARLAADLKADHGAAAKLEDNSIKFEIDLPNAAIVVDNCPPDQQHNLAEAIAAVESYAERNWPELWAEGVHTGHLTAPVIGEKARFGASLAAKVRRKLSIARSKRAKLELTLPSESAMVKRVLAGRLKLATAEKRLTEARQQLSAAANRHARLASIYKFITTPIKIYGNFTPDKPKKWEVKQS